VRGCCWTRVQELKLRARQSRVGAKEWTVGDRRGRAEQHDFGRLDVLAKVRSAARICTIESGTRMCCLEGVRRRAGSGLGKIAHTRDGACAYST
jgi:hypothetical protein